ncbi:DUF389 domain-containing protein [Acetobacterium sp.]|jgi:uncharacterized hydrophobic protein (TIGR00271 family)|uniref:DUF389 domain-containing protein n=1 Tax=Acetobacterium sp. TaxID=1872094 RepID=UPI000CC12E41|nr:DUF389 domain-containing protein [Acetobacterium sp.]MDO9490650.1 DUF389 domain-containing protein [Acetobacterium sp.]PKM74584.1 MAG: TIGR00341 family protein [Firmicutes bacterium HGW-Firmicutes-17]
MIDDLKKSLFDIRSDQMDAEAIHESIVSGVRLKGATLIILFCAIIVASVGLNTNSTAVIIGAMLISPLMNPIITVGYSIATYDGILLRNAMIKFAIQIAIAVVGSTIYFSLTPIHEPTSELIARTGPSFFDMLIAFFGGSAGIIGITRKEKSNVIPGVAIATALMPPMCTVGYGIANGNIDFIFSAAYLFAINAFFIIVATFAFCKLLQLKQADVVKARYNKIIKRVIVIGVILITIPAAVTAVYVSATSIQEKHIYSSVESFVNNEVNSASTTTMRATIDPNKKYIRLDLIGDMYTEKEIDKIRQTMEAYGFDDYYLEVVQDIKTTLFHYFENVNSGGITESEIVIE